MTKGKLIILKGLPASGKTTWAKAQVEAGNGQVKRVNKDDLREMIDGGKWSKDREKHILEVRNDVILQYLGYGHTVIVDDTNLAPKHVEEITHLLESLDVDIEINDSFLSVPLRECIARDYGRTNPVGRDVINRMARQFGVGTTEPYPIDPTLPTAVICDLDGTLFLIGSRNPYDASTCLEDKINRPVEDYLKMARLRNYAEFPDGAESKSHKPLEIFFFSGREERYRALTQIGLRMHGFPEPSYQLAMRPTGDNRKDCIVKREMFEEHIRGKFNVHVVLDDRDQVVEMWRDLGLNVWQVAEGNF